MIRPFKFKKRINWKYALGEIFLIFIGINLAIWFNNWNASKQTRAALNVSIQKIEEEIQSNSEKVKLSYENVLGMVEFLTAYNKLFNAKGNIVTTPEKIAQFQKEFPKTFVVQDSFQVDEHRFMYDGDAGIQLELIELADIAWETTKTLNVLNQFGYECLYDLESLYNLQNRTQHELDKAADALQASQLKELRRVLLFLRQFEEQLQELYPDMLDKLNSCS